jgi:hypothetical protein
MTQEMNEQLVAMVATMNEEDFSVVAKMISNRKQEIKTGALADVINKIHMGCSICWSDKDGLHNAKVVRINPTYVRADDGIIHNCFVPFGKITDIDGESVGVLPVQTTETEVRTTKKTSKKAKK